MATHITGMTPSMYKRHARATTYNPYTIPGKVKGGIYNNFYQSGRLGTGVGMKGAWGTKKNYQTQKTKKEKT